MPKPTPTSLPVDNVETQIVDLMEVDASAAVKSTIPPDSLDLPAEEKRAQYQNRNGDTACLPPMGSEPPTEVPAVLPASKLEASKSWINTVKSGGIIFYTVRDFGEGVLQKNLKRWKAFRSQF